MKTSVASGHFPMDSIDLKLYQEHKANFSNYFQKKIKIFNLVKHGAREKGDKTKKLQMPLIAESHL
jgi:hypothetical protein